MQTRVGTLAGGDVASRSMSAVLVSGERPVAVADWRSGGVVDEVLVLDGLELPPHVPLVDSHNTGSTDRLRGSVQNVKVDNGQLVGRLVFARDPDSESAFIKAQDKHLRGVSVGYSIVEATDVPVGKSAKVGGRLWTAGARTLRVTTRWRLAEVSLVIVGADEHALIRKAQLQQSRRPAPSKPAKKKESTMPPLKRIDLLHAPHAARLDRRYGEDCRAIAAWMLARAGEEAPAQDLRRAGEMQMDRLRDVAARICEIEGVPVDRDALMTCSRAMMTAAANDIFTLLLNSSIMAGWEASDDTTAAWTSEAPSGDFKTIDRVGYGGVGRLSKVPRGGTAESVGGQTTKESYRIARYGKYAEIDEQDMMDDRIDAIVTIPRELGEAARQLRPDLVYAILLANAALDSDGVALFHADHGNLSTSALSSTSLGAAIADLEEQTAPDGRNLNLRPTHLLCPPALKQTAVSAVFDYNQAVAPDERIRIVSESRIGVAGVTDPATGTAYAGTATNWFLVSARGRTIEVSGLEGSLTPNLRTYALGNGQWGIGYDISLDIGAAALDYRAMFRSTGTV